MRYGASRQDRRSGAMAPLLALLLIPLIALIAFAVDLGYLVQVKTELQSVADAAALAGAQELMDPYTRWVVPSANKDAIRSAAITSARDAARKYAAANYAGGVSITLQDSDIEVGFVDALGTYHASPAATQYPNTVKLTARRDGAANKPVSLFFAPVLGTKSVELETIARATIFTGLVKSFKNAPGRNIHLLPMTYDVDHWDNFIKTGKDPDGNITKDAHGDPEIQVYPSVKYKGNFGELALDDAHAGSSDIKDWIKNGLPTSGVQTLIDNHLIPTTAHPANTWDWLGNPGFKSTTVQEVNEHIGETFYLPLFHAKDSSSTNYLAGVGGGSGYNYDIVRFVPITIMTPPDKNKEIVVQPNGFIEPTAIFDLTTVVPAGTTSSTLTSFTTPKLTE